MKKEKTKRVNPHNPTGARNPQGKEEKEKGVRPKDSREWNLLSLKFSSCMAKMQENFNDKKIRIAWDEIKSCYSEPYRKYHGKNHIARMIYLLIKYEKIIPEEMFYLALVTICLHDYDKCPLNSAQKANEILKEVGVEPEFITIISKMILKTDHAASPNLENDTQKLIVCLDLAPLAINPESFAKNTQNLWFEYKHQNLSSSLRMDEKKDDFIAGCYHLFNVLFSRKKIYPLTFFEKKYEDKARRNMKWLMDQPVEFWEEFLVD